jgi:hypothetical protein
VWESLTISTTGRQRPVNVTNTTISNNEGSAIRQSKGELNVSNCTISNNFGGIIGFPVNNPGIWSVKSSIVAANGFSDAIGAFTSGGFNLIGNPFQGTGFTAATDQVGNAAAPLDRNSIRQVRRITAD